MPTFSSEVTQLVRNLVTKNGRDAAGFSGGVANRGGVWVRSNTTAVQYLREGWPGKFVQHLRRGWFDAQQAPD
jgi:hypothetical protein